MSVPSGVVEMRNGETRPASVQINFSSSAKRSGSSSTQTEATVWSAGARSSVQPPCTPS
ncbi:MAG: hypothetical protein QM811_22155 [Pirellulales bacterium]